MSQENKKQDVIYHYCNTEAFMGIMQTKQLWLTRTDFLNDRHECLQVGRIFQEIMRSYKKDKEKIQHNINDVVERHRVVGLTENYLYAAKGLLEFFQENYSHIEFGISDYLFQTVLHMLRLFHSKEIL